MRRIGISVARNVILEWTHSLANEDPFFRSYLDTKEWVRSHGPIFKKVLVVLNPVGHQLLLSLSGCGVIGGEACFSI